MRPQCALRATDASDTHSSEGSTGPPGSGMDPACIAPFFPRELTFDGRRRREARTARCSQLPLEFALAQFHLSVVGAFLHRQANLCRVVRRRPDIGIIRALGAGRAAILAAFVG